MKEEKLNKIVNNAAETSVLQSIRYSGWKLKSK